LLRGALVTAVTLTRTQRALDFAMVLEKAADTPDGPIEQAAGVDD